MDTGYVDGDHLVSGQTRYGLELLGPVVSNGSWQAKDEQAYDLSKFAIDWQRQIVTCPAGKISRKWTGEARAHGSSGHSRPIRQAGLPGLPGPQPLYQRRHQPASSDLPSSGSA